MENILGKKTTQKCTNYLHYSSTIQYKTTYIIFTYYVLEI